MTPKQQAEQKIADLQIEIKKLAILEKLDVNIKKAEERLIALNRERRELLCEHKKFSLELGGNNQECDNCGAIV